jgi:hypothetical protein
VVHGRQHANAAVQARASNDSPGVGDCDQPAGIPLFHIAYTVEGAGLRPHDATFIVATKDHRTESLMVTLEEIADSAHRIDSFADAKFRVLVSRCSGGRECATT